MSIPIWAPSPIQGVAESHRIAILEIIVTEHQIQVKDPEIGEVYLTTYVYTPDVFSLTVKFDANGVKSIEAIKE